MLFYGPPGTGKSTLAKLIVKNINCDYIYINASDERGIETIRDKVSSFASTASFKHVKIVVLDECLDEDTLVTVLRQGEIKQIPIKDVDEKNDLVKSYNIEKEKIEWKPFYLWDKGEQETYEIEFENGEVIICTPDHKWYVEGEDGTPKVVKTTDLEDYMEIFNPKG
jgi:intein/homing endonuclease